LRPELAVSLGPERFLREIEVAAHLTHPNILPLHDSSTANGLLYYVMPFVDGESLRDRLDREKQLALEDALQITREVADALSFAHCHGVVHRDIKPENILLEAGHALVADFGIAHALNAAGSERITESGIAVGTAAYMSPEQTTCEKDLDARSDVYSLGCVLYEMLAGEPPFTGPTPQVVFAKRLSEPVPHISTLRETVPPCVEQAINTALARVPVDRYPTTRCFAEALTAPSGEGTLAQEPIRRVGLRHPVMLVVGAMIALAVTLGLWQGVGSESDTTLDPNLLAVMPFRTAAADPSLAYLREGMMDMLAPKLTGDGGPRAANPRTVMAAWRRVASANDADLTEEQAARVARAIGAGQLLLGSVVGSPGRVVLTATLSSVLPGSLEAAQATVEGPEDSLHVAGGLLDQLAGQLLAGGAGVQDVHGASLTTSSLAALKAYLAGQSAFRAGQYDEAVHHLSRALGIDSGFTLAAVALSRNEGWVATVPNLGRVREIAWHGRSQLNLEDRTLLKAYMGPRGPDPDPLADQLRTREQAVSAMPGQADAWFLLGDMYYHFGSLLGFADAFERAEQAFERAVALDSTYVAPLKHLTQLVTKGGDTTKIRRLWQLSLQLDSTTYRSDQLRFSVALALGDEEMRADALDRLATQGWLAAAEASLFAQTDRGAEHLDTLIAIMQSRAGTQNERDGAAWYGYVAAMNRGRPRHALSLISNIWPENSEWHLLKALYWNGLLKDTALVLHQADSIARAPFGPTAVQRRGQLVTACRLARWRLAQGEMTGVATLLQRLEAGLTMGDSVVPHRASPLCTCMVRAMLAVRQGWPEAVALVEIVDSILLSFPESTDYAGIRLGNFMVVELWEAPGQLHGRGTVGGSGASRAGAGGGQTAGLPPLPLVPVDQAARRGAARGVDRRPGRRHPGVHPLSRVALRSGTGGGTGGECCEGRAGTVAGGAGMNGHRQVFTVQTITEESRPTAKLR